MENFEVEEMKKNFNKSIGTRSDAVSKKIFQNQNYLL